MFIFKPMLQSEVSEEFRSGNNASRTSHSSWQCHGHLGLKISTSLLRACRPFAFYFVDVESFPAQGTAEMARREEGWGEQARSGAAHHGSCLRPAAGSGQSSAICQSAAGCGKREQKGTEGCVLQPRRQSPRQCFPCSCLLWSLSTEGAHRAQPAERERWRFHSGGCRRGLRCPTGSLPTSFLSGCSAAGCLTVNSIWDSPARSSSFSFVVATGKKKKLVFLKAVWSGGCISFCCDVFVLVSCFFFFFLPQLFSTTFMLPSFRICFYSAHKTLHFDMYFFFFDVLTLGVLAWFLLSPLPGKQQGCSHAQCCANQAVVRLISAQCVK